MKVRGGAGVGGIVQIISVTERIATVPTNDVHEKFNIKKELSFNTMITIPYIRSIMPCFGLSSIAR